MSLNEKQWRFTRMVGQLILWAYDHGYTLSFGNALRSQAEAAKNAANGIGISNSLHCIALAVDLNLFIGGEYQAKSEAYEPLGLYWESLHPMNRWGGRFRDSKGRPKPDGNHFSYEHEGRK